MEIGDRASAEPIGAASELRRPLSLRRWSAKAPSGVMLLFGAAVVALYAAAFAPLVYPYSGDSPSYIEAARSLMAGQPLLYSVPFGYDGEWQIFRLWPPGYPVLIAAVAGFGIDAATAALWLTRLSLTLLPMAVYWALRDAVGRRIALTAALLSVSSVGLLPFAHLVSSDPAFALVGVLSLGVLLRGLAPEAATIGRSAWLLTLAGLLAALAISIRNSGLALVVAESATIAALTLVKEETLARLVRRGVSYGIGLGLGLLPLMIWNIAAFGVLRPYYMPPSTVGVRENVHHLVDALLLDLLSMAGTGETFALVIAALGCACLLAVIATGVAQLRMRDPYHLTPPMSDQRAWEFQGGRLAGLLMVFAACYGFATALMLVIARSRYEWGEMIGFRHVAQFDWLLLAAAIGAVALWLPSRRTALVLLVTVSVSLLGLRAGHFVANHDRLLAEQNEVSPRQVQSVGKALGGAPSRSASLIFSRSAAAADLIANIPAHCDIVSNAAGVIQASYRRRARQVWNAEVTMEDFAHLVKPTVLIFAAVPESDKLQPPTPTYRVIRNAAFVAFQPAVCQPGGADD